jgi:uncharacterized protein
MDTLDALIESGDFHGVRKALDENPRILEEPVEGAPSPILLAVYRGQIEIAHLLRERKRDLELQEAAALGDLHELERLLGSDAALVDQYSADGFFPLGYAAFFGHSMAVDLLLRLGASIDQISLNPLGITALHASLANGHKEIAMQLVRAGADVDLAQQAEGFTPLHYCAYRGDRETAELLLEGNSLLDAKDKEGRIPAELAEERGFTDLAEVLRPKGA